MTGRVNFKTLEKVSETFKKAGVKCGGVKCPDCALYSPVFKHCAFNMVNSCHLSYVQE